jgi:hypothetical protein
MGYAKISVIVPVYNRARLVRECLKSLCAQQYPDFEVIAVDDGSTDGTADAVREFPVKLVTLEGNAGAARARNAGARSASGTWLAFTDSDCCAPPGWLGMLASRMDENPGCAGVNGTYSADLSGTFISGFAFRINRLKESGSPEYISTCNTSCFLCRRDDFLRAGGFPVVVSANGREVRGREDALLGHLLCAGGGRIIMAPDIGVGHYFRSGWKGFLAQQFIYASRFGMHGVSEKEVFSGASSFSRRTTVLQTLCLGIAFVPLPFAVVSPGAGVFSIAALAVFFLSYGKILREYSGLQMRIRCAAAIAATTIVWGIGGGWGMLAGVFCKRKTC